MPLNKPGRSGGILPYLFLYIPVVWAALLIAQSLGNGLPELLTNLTAALQTPLKIRWTEHSLMSIQGKNREKLIADTQDIVSLTNSTQFSGNIISDWKIVLAIIENEQSEVYQNLLKDARHLRLLQRGSQLYAALDILWRENGSYIGATEAVANALTQEHFSMSTRKWSGVNVMTIHKSKGKEFDAVIVYEGRYQNRIISKPERREQATLNLRVAVTRAKEHTYILTPNDDPCSLL